MSNVIEEAIKQENWEEARSLIKSKLKQFPNDHWLITRLGLTYYEQRQYKRALHYSEKALSLAPHCPLILWDYAGSLDMLQRPKQAAAIYKRILQRGINQIAYGESGEGSDRRLSLSLGTLLSRAGSVERSTPRVSASFFIKKSRLPFDL